MGWEGGEGGVATFQGLIFARRNRGALDEGGGGGGGVECMGEDGGGGVGEEPVSKLIGFGLCIKPREYQWGRAATCDVTSVLSRVLNAGEEELQWWRFEGEAKGLGGRGGGGGGG